MLASFLKSIGCIIPLMDAMYASYYTREVMVVLVREFQTPDEEMKKIVLKVRCPGAWAAVQGLACKHARQESEEGQATDDTAMQDTCVVK